MNPNTLSALLDRNGTNAVLAHVYGEASDRAADRLRHAVCRFSDLYGNNRDLSVFSVPGRSELSGNHTDHNHGRVIAASVDLDMIAVVSPRDDACIRITSEGFEEIVVNIDSYVTPDPVRYGTSASLVAGMCALFGENGLRIGGFDAYMTSDVLKGSGLSSSAAFEDMIGNILNHLYNDGKVDSIEIAKFSQKAENLFFGKPCGLMDQVACAHGGIVAIDFETPASPVITPLSFDLTAAGYSLCIVNTGGNHADLTEDYASIPAEMKAVAKEMGGSVLRQTKEAAVIEAIPALREKVGDRAILRALHFFAENRRVALQTSALQNGDVPAFLAGVRASGHSSFEYLQNLYTIKDPSCQGLPLALCLAERVLDGKVAACRVHGGGFAGTIQAFVPADTVEPFRQTMDKAFGKGACLALHVRMSGAVRLF